MKKLKYIILIAILGVFTLSSCGYNSMVNKQESVTAQWAQVQNAYQRRADLIPNLVSTVKGYASHEQETFTAVIEARSRATQVNVNPEDLTEEGIKYYTAEEEEDLVVAQGNAPLNDDGTFIRKVVKTRLEAD